LIQYLNRNDVQKALHTKPGIKWTICAKGVINYHKDGLPRTHLYRELVKMGIEGEHSLNMLVYSGDDDSVCSTAGTQEWIYDLGAEAGENLLWKPWKANEQTAGFVTHFDLGDSADATFTFVTVHGAGHEVPAYRPIEALQMFRMFLRGEW
jgi:carboxypeptidase C (cathepsin A)